ncbi:hypothetical protein GCM10007301_43840 [Azorhizobium oxalatiphilum]|uniref:Uncharacterized protein n=1 Tax=Azorhizobium oxalatiphilum TaxID=980631 RepID=A0A917C9M5_9HYPH|nr:hypothetical protein GCM10007301_43840 [Azorhizobium oxalatiphilum]
MVKELLPAVVVAPTDRNLESDMLRKLALTGALVSLLGIAAFMAPHEANAGVIAATIAGLN